VDVFRELAAALRDLAPDVAGANPPSGTEHKSGAQKRLDLLWERLGPGTRKFLLHCADELGTREFSVEDMSDAAGESEGAVRARLRNLGRSLKSLGPNAPTLWESYWDDEQMVYTFDSETREAILTKSVGK
jgi:hypothetical protein